METHIAVEVDFKMEELHSDCGVYQTTAEAEIYPENGSTMFLRNVGLQTTSQHGAIIEKPVV